MRTVVLYIEVQGKKFGSDDEGKHKQETDDGNANVPRHGLICGTKGNKIDDNKCKYNQENLLKKGP